jgi:hypothetical protein
MQSVPLEFLRKGQQSTRVPGSSRPVDEIPVLLEFCYFPQPLCAALIRNGDHVGKITRPQAAADCQLNALQQPSGAPLLFKPIHRNRGSTVFRVSTATSLANREMSDNEPLRCQRMCRVGRHKFSLSPVRPRTTAKIVRAPDHAPKKLAEATGRS